MSHTFHFFPSIHRCRVHVWVPPSTRPRTNLHCSSCTCPDPPSCHSCTGPGHYHKFIARNLTKYIYKLWPWPCQWMAPWKVSMSLLYRHSPHIWSPTACRRTDPSPVCARPPSLPHTWTIALSNNKNLANISPGISDYLLTCPRSATSWPRIRVRPCWPSPRHSTSSRARHRPGSWTPQPPRGSCWHWPRPDTRHNISNISPDLDLDLSLTTNPLLGKR